MRFRLADVSTRTLAKIATYGAVATIGGLILVRSRLEDRVRQSEFYRLAMKTLRSNPGARLLLGEPMKEHGFDLGDSKLNYCDKTQARFKVSVQGPKDKGYMFFWAVKGKEESWIITQLELALKNEPDKLLVIVKRQDDTSEE